VKKNGLPMAMGKTRGITNESETYEKWNAMKKSPKNAKRSQGSEGGEGNNLSKKKESQS